MSRTRKMGRSGAAALLLMVTGANAGPVWDEVGDAGSSAAVSQTTNGNGQLAGIKGSMTATNLLGTLDTEDLYLIRICDPAGFIASLRDADGGFTSSFNSQLFLFDTPPGMPGTAFGLLANDDADSGAPDARLLPLSDDDSGAALIAPGLYHLGITVANRDPASINGAIFDQASFTEISGPDGPGGASPLIGFGGPAGPVSFPGEYLIALSGTTFGSTPAVDCNCNRRVDACDIVLGTSLDLNFDGIPDECACKTDLDGNGETGFGDLLQVLAAWGPCVGPCPEDLDCTGVVAFGDLLLVLSSWGRC